MRRNWGWRPNLPDIRDQLYILGKRLDFPKYVSLEQKISRPIDDQGSSNECSVLAVLAMIQDEKHYSHEFTYRNAALASAGEALSFSSIFKSIELFGVVEESKYQTYVQNRCVAACYKDPSTLIEVDLKPYKLNGMVIDQLQQCLAVGFPFVFGMSVYESFLSDETEKTGFVSIPKSTEKLLGGHAMCCIGYDQANEAFIVRNSFGPKWGMHGHCYIPYNYMTSSSLTGDFWTVRKG